MYRVTRNGNPAFGGRLYDSPAEAKAAIDSLRELVSAGSLRQLKVEKV